MRKIKYIILGFLTMLMVSCENDLKIDPQQSLPDVSIFTSGLLAQGTLIGCYSLMQDIDVFGSMPQITSEYMSDNVEFIGSFPSLQQIYNYRTTPTNGSLTGWWRDHYRVILATNAVIANVPGIDDTKFTEAQRKRIVSEARFIRALTYFNLVNLWGQPYTFDNGVGLAVPLVEKPFSLKVELFERSTVSQIHDFIKSDLEAALPDLPSGKDNTRASVPAAKALLARLHLYRGEFAEAAANAQAVVANARFELAKDYSFFANGTGSEYVFTLVNSATDNGRTGAGGWASYHRPAEQGGRGDAPFSKDLIDAFLAEDGDKRYTTLSDVGRRNGKRYTKKFPDARTHSDNVPIIRITEMHLTLAEALAEQKGVNSESVSIINKLRDRAGLKAISTPASKEALLDIIATERRKELCFEGHRRMDLLRRGKALRKSGEHADKSSPGNHLVVMPVPQREIDQNAKLKQTQGY